MSKRAILYARVSTVDQSDKGYSLPTQILECQKYAERLGFTIVKEFREDYSGATPFDERPEGKKVAALLKAHQADAIIGHQVDRLSRDNIDLLVSVRQWLRAGIEVYSTDIGKIEDENNILLVIKGWQGSDERAKIRERTTRGRNHKARLMVVGGGHAPYGYRFIRQEGKTIGLEILDDEGKIVRRIYSWYLEGMPLRAIARKLSISKVPTPGELRPGIARKRAAGMWNEATIRLILHNETYCGVWHFLKTVRNGNHYERRDEKDQTSVPVPALIDRATWERAQQRLKYNQRMSKRNCQHDYLLRGMIRCGCGAAMQGQHVMVNGYEYFYYICTSHQHVHAGLESECQEKAVRREIVESKAWEYAMNLFANRELLEQTLEKAQQAELDSLAPKRERLVAVEGLISDCDREIGELTEMVKRVKGLVGQRLQSQIDDAESRYSELLQERDELHAELSTQKVTEQVMEAARQFRKDIVAGLMCPTFEDKRRVLELLQAQVVVHEKQAKVRLELLLDVTTASRRSSTKTLTSSRANRRKSTPATSIRTIPRG